MFLIIAAGFVATVVGVGLLSAPILAVGRAVHCSI
jgi:hypothetical protein